MTGSIFLDTTEQSVGETDGNAYVTIVRTGNTSGAVTVTFGVTADNATPGADYTVPATNTVIIPAGAGFVQVPIEIIDDGASESTESFVFSIINVDSGTILAPRTDRIYILDDENPVQQSPSPPLFANYNVGQQTVITGLNQPIKFEFSPVNSSRMYVAEKGGMIKVYNKDTGAFVSNFVDLTGVVNEFQDRGLLDIVLHPNFAANPYLYAFYVVDPPDTVGQTGNAGPDGGGNRFSYLVRYTADAATNYTTVVPGSGVILLGNTGLTLGDINGNGALDFTDPAQSAQTASDIYLNPARGGAEPVVGGYKQNYLKDDSRSHAGGSLAFGPDGMLYVSVGDGTSFDYADPRSVSVQNLNSLAGKVLRIDPITGLGLSTNPYASGQPLDSNQAKVFQLGLRNPFSMGFDASGRLFISDTGWNTWEEINSAPAGANFGWPYYEGGDSGILDQTGDYQDLPSAPAFYAAVQAGTIVITPAIRAFGHSAVLPGYQIQAITGGDVIYTGNRYPAAFQDDYFFADFSNGNVFSIDTNDRREVEFLYNAGANQFAPVHMSQGPDGYVYMADLINGTILRLLIESYPLPAPRSWVTTGNATQISAVPIEYRLTIDDSDQLGTVTYSSRLDLRRNFTVSFDAYLGLLDNGADGIGFMLHNASIGPFAHGDGGGAFGIQNLPNGIGIAFDTYANDGEIENDKTYFLNAATGARTTAIALSNLEDGNYHPVVVTWNAASKTLSYTVDSVLRGTLSDANFFNTYLGGSPFAYFGFGGATGGAVNEQRTRLNSISGIYEHNLTVATDRGDFNGDNRTDFLWNVTDGRAAIWLMNGTTITYGDVVGPNPGPTWHIKGTGDYNGDGYSDIVWETDGRRAAIWELQGTQVIFGDIAGPQVPVGWHIVGTGDYNGDGRSDILWETPDHRAAIWLMNGTQVTFGDIAGPQVAADWHIKGTGDFDADGKSDILWQTDGGIAAIWLMDGTAVKYGDIVGPNPGPTWHIKGTGDFNGDGYSDIVWQTDTGIAAIWEVKGTQVIYGDIVGPNPGTSWQLKGTGDLNNDGKSDIIWQTNTGLPAAWLIDGTTVTFGDIIPPNPGTSWQLIGPTG